MTNKKLIKLYSKDKNSLKLFVQLLNKITHTWKNTTFVSKGIKKRKKKVTVLKSPHVNKKAQTQFQVTTYSTTLIHSPWELKKSQILLKKIRNHLFPDVKIKIEQTVIVKKVKIQIKNQLLPKKVLYYKGAKNLLEKQKLKKNLIFCSNNKKNSEVLLKKTLQFLKMLDHYGNINLIQ